MSVKECPETALGLVIEGCIVVSDRMLFSTLSVLVEALEMLCAKAADLKPEDLPSPLCLMCIFKKLHLSWIHFCLSIISFRACLDLDCVSLP